MLFLTNDSWLQIYKYGTWYVLSGSSLREEGIEWIITSSKGFVAGHLTIRLDSMLQAVKLPTSVAHLATSLANVDGDTFPLKLKKSNLCKFTTVNYFKLILLVNSFHIYDISPTKCGTSFESSDSIVYVGVAEWCDKMLSFLELHFEVFSEHSIDVFEEGKELNSELLPTSSVQIPQQMDGKGKIVSHS